MRSPEQCKDERLLQATLSTESSLLIILFNIEATIRYLEYLDYNRGVVRKRQHL